MTTQIAMADLTNVLFAREYAYDILRRFFIEEPSKDYLKYFVQQNMIDQFPFLEDSEGMQEGIDDIKQYLKEFDVANNQSHFDDLHWDYTRMFIGPFELPAPPWESVYVRKDRLLFQQTTMDVRKEYKKFRIEVADFNLESDDHIGLELDFIYHLNKLCINSDEGNNPSSLKEITYLLQEQQRFIKQHLLAFAPEFADKVIDNAETTFYVGLAKVLKHFLKVDSEVLEELLKIDIIN